MKSNQEEKECEKCGYYMRNHQFKDDKYYCPEITITPQSPSKTREECECVNYHHNKCPNFLKNEDNSVSSHSKDKILEEWEDEMRSILFYFWNNYKECSDVIERDEIIEKSINKLSSALSEQKENTKREIEKMKKEMNCFQDNKPGMHYECDCAEKASYNQALDDIINNI